MSKMETIPSDPLDRLRLIATEMRHLDRDFFDDDHAPADLAALVDVITQGQRGDTLDAPVADALLRLADRAAEAVKRQDERMSRIFALAAGKAE